MGLGGARSQTGVISSDRQSIYIRHFQKPIFQLAVQRNRINLLVYEPQQEAIVQWIAH